jgi:DNA (cytosine-5)-methyltransferase 1
MDVDNPKELTHISLCAGYGGIDLGLKRALGDVRTIAFSEIEAFACANLVAKMEAGLLESAPIWTNLKTFPWERFRGKVDILSGGFPCQPFSAAGQRAGTEDLRHLFPFILGGVRLCRPAVVFLENVEGIISSRLKGDDWSDPEGTPVLLHVIRELERVGYQATAGVFSAAEVGAPHQRKRVFIMAKDGDVELPAAEYTSATYYPAGRGQEQHEWEPSRTVGNATSERLEGRRGTEQGIRDGDRPSVASREELASPDSERRGQDLEQPTKQGTAGIIQRSGAKVADSVDSGLQGTLPQMEPGGSREEEARSTPRSSPRGHIHWQAQPAMGRDLDGIADRLDYAELCRACDNRTDELRLLGNGVVPDTAARAFRLLWRDLADPSRISTGRGLDGLS